MNKTNNNNTSSMRSYPLILLYFVVVRPYTRENVGLRFRGNTHSKAEKAYRTEMDGQSRRDSHALHKLVPCHLGNCTTAPQSIALISMCFRLTAARGPRLLLMMTRPDKKPMKLTCILFPAIPCNITKKK